MKELYPFQEAALASILPLTGKPLIVVPTGGGKSLLNAHAAGNNVSGRTLCLTHVKELIVQNEAELCDAMPWADIGVFSAGLDRREYRAQHIVGGVASVYRNLSLFKDVTQIQIDEAHRVSITRAKMYKAVLEHFPGVPVLGLTATPFRLGTGLLHEGPEAFFDRIAYEIHVRELMGDNYLSPLVSQSPRSSQMPTADLKMRGGEFTDTSLAELAAQAPLTHNALRDAMIRAEGRDSVLVFACNKDHAQLVKQYLTLHGETAGCVTDDTGTEERDYLVRAFKRMALRWLIHVNIFTTGFNHPELDCIVMLRPTASPVIYVQAYGRGTRIAPNKRDCLILDYAGNVARHGMFDDPNCGKANREPTINCAECETDYLKPFVNCPNCGALTPRTASIKPAIKLKGRESDKITDTPFEYPVLSDGSQWRQVRSWTWREHTSKAGNACLLIRYRCHDGNTINEFLVEGTPKFNEFLASVFGAFPKAPGTIDQAITAFAYCRRPRLILAKRQDDNPDYWRILKRELETN